MAEVKQNGTKGITRTIGTHPVIFFVLAIGILGMLAFFFLIVPGVRALEAGGTASIVDAQAKLDAERDALAAQTLVVDRVAKLSTDERTRIEANLPHEQDVPSMINQLSAIAVKDGIILQGLDLTVTDAKLSTEVPSSVKAIDIAMNIAGAPYVNLKAFFSDIERNLRLLDFRGLTASPSVGVASVNLRTYFVSAP